MGHGGHAHRGTGVAGVGLGGGINLESDVSYADLKISYILMQRGPSGLQGKLRFPIETLRMTSLPEQDQGNIPREHGWC